MKPTYKQVTKTRYIEQISQLAEEIAPLSSLR